MFQRYLTDPELLAQPIDSLSIELRTGDAPHAGTDDPVYCNVGFADGSLLFAPENFALDTQGHDDRERGQTDTYPLPIPAGLGKKVSEIAELTLRKAGRDGWQLGSALLFANGFEQPVIGNSQVNQFLDNDRAVLGIRDWSTGSICGANDLPAQAPLVGVGYRTAGPVLGQISDTTANVLYRVDREGRYRLRVHEVASEQQVWSEVQTLSPAARFRVTGLLPDTHYAFRFFRVANGEEIPRLEDGGEFRTHPADGSGVRFSFAFGSCSRSDRDAAQTSWTGIRNLAADPAGEQTGGIRWFVHLGDTFYFYDDVLGQEPESLASVRAAHLSQRRHPGFLAMARRVPSVAVWDDHDFRLGNAQSTNYPARLDSLTGFLEYWGNDPIDRTAFGLTTRMGYGNVDLYLLDGRYHRDRKRGICFTRAQLDHVVETIAERGAVQRAGGGGRLVIVASGSTWNHTWKKGEAYGHGDYNQERERFFHRLAELLGSAIQGLVFLSGDIHRNEIYQIVLAAGLPGREKRLAPEFVSSPLGNNSKLTASAKPLEGERRWSVPSKGPHARRGFATLDLDTTNPRPEDNWTIVVNYHDAHAPTTAPYHSQRYTLSGGQFGS